MSKTAQAYKWDDIEIENPIPTLDRQRVIGEKILVAKLDLKRGCVVDLHSHPNEQVSVFLSGRARWKLQDPDGSLRHVEMGAGEVLVIPGGVPHGIEVLEDTEVFDLLSPPGEMGIDRQGRASSE
ncbi:MAG: cupin domain-containing protein [Trueperaceae bacterium]|nr:MAG: cupin domain-containing protein [Trueperaceae bacterium]